mmetsp:Transcript_29265/g.80154  ORF Transcript_29265/g.80154 Transcript_29265/m.80154 type:complete len:120 (+) Transcript_29265:91-450(+)
MAATPAFEEHCHGCPDRRCLIMETGLPDEGPGRYQRDAAWTERVKSVVRNLGAKGGRCQACLRDSRLLKVQVSAERRAKSALKFVSGGGLAASGFDANAAGNLQAGSDPYVAYREYQYF